jgi:hypothetical protein
MAEFSRSGGVLTRELFEQGLQAMLNWKPQPDIEYHDPCCPKWLTHGQKACRCGVAPLEAVFEDELERMAKVGR